MVSKSAMKTMNSRKKKTKSVDKLKILSHLKCTLSIYFLFFIEIAKRWKEFLKT